MKPVLWSIGSFKIHSFGLFAAVGFVLAYVTWMRRAARTGLNQAQASSAAMLATLAGIAGARVYFVLQHPADFADRPAAVWALWEGGLVWYGGLLAGLVVFAVIVKRNRGRLRLALDAAAPALAIGQGFGRIGCFLNGCCYGVLCPLELREALCAGGRAPVQLAEASALFLLVPLLRWVERRTSIHPLGIFGVYLAGAGLIRFAAEFWRGDQVRGVWGFSVPQVAAFGIAALGIGWVVHGFCQKKSNY